MKIAVPLKLNKVDSAVSPLFGKAKWYAIVDGDDIKIYKNSFESGMGIVNWLREMGVNILIVQNMGFGPFERLLEDGDIKLYYAGAERITLPELLEKFKKNELSLLDADILQNIAKSKKRKHS